VLQERVLEEAGNTGGEVVVVFLSFSQLSLPLSCLSFFIFSRCNHWWGKATKQGRKGDEGLLHDRFDYAEQHRIV
jgi:hypothetical protein